MGFFSKLFKNEDEAAEQSGEGEAGALANDESAVAAARPAAPAKTEAAKSKSGTAAPSPSRARDAAPVVPKKEAAPPAPTAGRASVADAPAAPPLPAGASADVDAGRASRTSPTPSRTGGAAARKSMPEPPAPRGSTAGLKVGGAAAKRATQRGLGPAELAAARAAKPFNKAAPSPLPPAAEVPAVPAAKAADKAPPAMPAAPTATGGSSSADSIEDAVEAAVDRLVDAEPPRDAAELEAARKSDQQAAAETFQSLATAHAHQVREFMFQLSVGRTPRKWAQACRPILAPMLEAARQIELGDLVAALADFDAALELAASSNTPYIGPDLAQPIEEAYGKLASHLPEAFASLEASDGRRSLLLESLLLQVPSMHRRTLAKLYAAGLGSLEQLSGASPEEVAAVAGIDKDLAQALTQHVQRFERERSRIDPAALFEHVHGQLRTLIGRMRQLQEEFERAEQEEAAERKRAARRARETATHEVDLLLTEIGELSLVEELKRCAMRGKIQRVESYLERRQASA